MMVANTVAVVVFCRMGGKDPAPDILQDMGATVFGDVGGMETDTKGCIADVDALDFKLLLRHEDIEEILGAESLAAQ